MLSYFDSSSSKSQSAGVDPSIILDMRCKDAPETYAITENTGKILICNSPRINNSATPVSAVLSLPFNYSELDNTGRHTVSNSYGVFVGDGAFFDGIVGKFLEIPLGDNFFGDFAFVGDFWLSLEGSLDYTNFNGEGGNYPWFFDVDMSADKIGLRGYGRQFGSIYFPATDPGDPRYPYLYVWSPQAFISGIPSAEPTGTTITSESVYIAGSDVGRVKLERNGTEYTLTPGKPIDANSTVPAIVSYIANPRIGAKLSTLNFWMGFIRDLDLTINGNSLFHQAYHIDSDTVPYDSTGRHTLITIVDPADTLGFSTGYATTGIFDIDATGVNASDFLLNGDFEISMTLWMKETYYAVDTRVPASPEGVAFHLKTDKLEIIIKAVNHGFDSFYSGIQVYDHHYWTGVCEITENGSKQTLTTLNYNPNSTAITPFKVSLSRVGSKYYFYAYNTSSASVAISPWGMPHKILSTPIRIGGLITTPAYTMIGVVKNILLEVRKSLSSTGIADHAKGLLFCGDGTGVKVKGSSGFNLLQSDTWTLDFDFLIPSEALHLGNPGYGHRFFFFHQIAANPLYLAYAHTNGDNYVTVLLGANGSLGISTGTAITLEAWHHLHLERYADGPNWRLSCSVDGTPLFSPMLANGVYGSTGNDVWIGSYPTDYQGGLLGLMDNILWVKTTGL